MSESTDPANQTNSSQMSSSAESSTSTSVAQEPSQSAATSAKKWYKNPWIWVGVVALVIFIVAWPALFISGFFDKADHSEHDMVGTNMMPTPTVAMSVTPTPTSTVDLESSQDESTKGWTYHKSDLCQVSVPLPPETPGYTKGEKTDSLYRYWQYTQQSMAGQSASSYLKLVSHAYVAAMFTFRPGTPADGGSSISIYCSAADSADGGLQQFADDFVTTYAQDPDHTSGTDENGVDYEKDGRIYGQSEQKIGNVIMKVMRVSDFYAGLDEVKSVYLYVANNRRYLIESNGVDLTTGVGRIIMENLKF